MHPSIAFICNEYPPSPHGGIGTFTQLIGRALAARGFRVRVAGVYRRRNQGWISETDNGVEVFRYGLSGRDPLGVRARYALFKQLRRWARAGQIDIVEAPDFEGWLAGWPSLPIPVVARTHGSGTYFRRELRKPDTMRSRFAAQLEKWSMRRADGWCSVSQYTANRTRQLFGLKPADAVIYNPVVIPDIPSDIERSRNRVVFTGTLTFKKGIVALARAWRMVAAVRPDAELHIFGKDISGMEPQLRRECGVEAGAHVFFHGHTARPQVLCELARARAAVFPSYAEAFAFAPLEAMAAGCPTIFSTRTSGPEAITHNVDGLLVDPDHPRDLADAILSILGDDGLAERLGKAGREAVTARFSLETILPAIEAFYLSAIARFHDRMSGSAALWPSQNINV